MSAGGETDMDRRKMLQNLKNIEGGRGWSGVRRGV